jgi:hypothetical protein
MDIRSMLQSAAPSFLTLVASDEGAVRGEQGSHVPKRIGGGHVL